MQAGFPVAPQTPVALQPRQMVQPLPSGTERTLVAVPQFGVALANALANDPPVDQATVPAAQSATSGQDILAAMSVATRTQQPPSRCRCLDCRLRRWILPCQQRQSFARPLSRRARSPIEQGPFRRRDRTSRAASRPAEPDFACVRAPDGRVDHNGASGCGRQRRESGRRRPAIAGGRDTGPVAEGHRSSDGTTGPGQPCCQEFRATGRREPCAASCAAIHRGDAAELAPCGSDSTFRG